MGMSGADVDQLFQLSKDMIASSEQLVSVQARLTGQIRTTPWHGRDADTFLTDWVTHLVPATLAASKYLAASAKVVATNAVQQKAASAANDIAFPVVLAATTPEVVTAVNKARKPVLNALTLARFFASGDEAALLKLASPTGVFGKFLLPVALATEIHDIVTGGGDQGIHGDFTRVASVVGLIGSGIGALALVAPLAPEILAVGAAATIAYGAYSAGNYIYHHREAIGRGLSAAGDYVADKSTQAVDAGRRFLDDNARSAVAVARSWGLLPAASA